MILPIGIKIKIKNLPYLHIASDCIRVKVSDCI